MRCSASGMFASDNVVVEIVEIFYLQHIILYIKMS